MFIHGWIWLVASIQDRALDPNLVDARHHLVEPQADLLHASGRAHEKIEPHDASDSTRPLAVPGRAGSSVPPAAGKRGIAMAFVQIIEFRTSNIDAMQEVADRWEEATAGKRTAGRRILCRDHNDASRYFNVVFFDSYESAMENSSLPETQRLSAEMMSFADGPPAFYDLDIIDDRS